MNNDPVILHSIPKGEKEISTEKIEALESKMSEVWINFAKMHDPGFAWRP